MADDKRYRMENSRAAGTFLSVIRQADPPAAVVHHNDADGLCAAAALSRAFDILSVRYVLLPIEKIHEVLVQKIHARHRGCLMYADLGGQNASLISRHSQGAGLVIILDHHLPEGGTADNLIHLNPENFGINGDREVSGASVAAVFAQELLRQVSVAGSRAAAELAIFGVIGAFGDRQVEKGRLTGINQLLLLEAEKEGGIKQSGETYILPGFGDRTPKDIAEMLDLLGSIGYYSGTAHAGIRFLLGRDQGEAVDAAANLLRIKQDKFDAEIDKIKGSGINESRHVAWVDVQEGFFPMGVKAIGLFLEQLIQKGIADPDKYAIGFQHLPETVPGIGPVDISLTKVSARVGEGLREKIAHGAHPDFMQLIPEATRAAGGIADGCHRLSAASLIERGREQAFIDALEHLLA